MKGSRAPLLTALLARAPAAHVQFWPLQQLIWQVEGGLSYNEMPLQSKQLIDQLVPDYKSELRTDFLTQLQGSCGKLGRIFPGLAGLCGPVNSLALDYQRIHQVLMQDENNYQALAQQFVHVIPGTAPYSRPTYWSRLNSRVYARLVGGAVYGEVAQLEVRVLSTTLARKTASESRGEYQTASFKSRASQYSNSPTARNAARVPFESLLAYPNQTASQVLGVVVRPVVSGLSSGAAWHGTPMVTISAQPSQVIAGDGVKISGDVREADGTPAAGTTVSLSVAESSASGNSSTGSPVSITTDASGRFSAFLETPAISGTVTVVANASTTPAASASVQITVLPIPALRVIRVSAEAPPANYPLVLPPRQDCSYGAKDGTVNNGGPCTEVYDYMEFTNVTATEEALPVNGGDVNISVLVQNTTGTSVQAPSCVDVSPLGSSSSDASFSPFSDAGCTGNSASLEGSSPSSVPVGASVTLVYRGTPRWEAFSLPQPNSLSTLGSELQTFQGLEYEIIGDYDTLASSVGGVVSSASPYFGELALGVNLVEALGSLSSLIGSVRAVLERGYAIRFPGNPDWYLLVADQPQQYPVFAAYLAQSLGRPESLFIPIVGSQVESYALEEGMGSNNCASTILQYSPSASWFYSALVSPGAGTGLTPAPKTGVLGKAISCTW